MSVTGNLTAGNLTTSGLISATGNLTAGNLNTTGNLYFNGNIFTRYLVVGRRTTPVSITLASNGSFNVLARSGNVTVYTSA